MTKLVPFLDKIINNDCLHVMREMPDDCVDCIVTDPPYGISFMGKHWDRAIPPVEIWCEAVRVLKPGAFAFVMCIPRQDCLSRMIISLEDAGFNVNFTSIYWAYACLSEDTKILTVGGLKSVDDVAVGDDVYSFDIPTSKMVRTTIRKKFIYPFNGKLYHLQNQNTDQLITLNHRVLCKHKYHSSSKEWIDNEWGYEKANQLKMHRALYIPISAQYEGSKSIGTDFARLLGWVITEGHFFNEDNASDIRIYQSSVNMSNVNEIREILMRLRVPFKEYQRKREYKEREYTEFCFYFSGK